MDTYAVWWDVKLKDEILRSGNRLFNFHVSDWLVETPNLCLEQGMNGERQIQNTLNHLWMREAARGAVEIEILSAQDWWLKPADTVVRRICERLSYL